MKVALGYLVAIFVLSIGLGFLVTGVQFGRIKPPPGAGLFWVLISCLLMTVFVFFGFVYLVEFVHTRKQGGSKVSWRNFGLRVLLSLTSLIGPYWMLVAHPTLAQRPVLLDLVNILVSGLTIGLLLLAWGIRLPVPGSSNGEEPGRASDSSNSTIQADQ